MAATSAGAVTVDPFDTPLAAGDNTNGSATASAFENFGMTGLGFTAAEDLQALISITINPFLTDLSGTPSNTISLSYSINGGSLTDLAIDPVDVGVGTVGAAGLALALSAGDSLSLFITGAAGRSGNVVTFAVETMEPMSEVPLPAALPLFLVGLAGFGAASRKRKAQA